MKIEVKDNNIEQALRVLKRKLQRDGFFKVIKLKNTYEKPSEKKKRILQENIKRVKKLNKLKKKYENENILYNNQYSVHGSQILDIKEYEKINLLKVRKSDFATDSKKFQ